MNNMYLYGLRDEVGNLYSFALGLDLELLNSSIISDISISLNDLKSNILLDNYNQILNYVELLKNSSIVKILDFRITDNADKEYFEYYDYVHCYFETVSFIRDNLDLVNLIDEIINICLSYSNKEVE